VGVVEIALVDAVAAVRDELVEAVARRPRGGVVFEVGEVVLEFEVELRQDTSVRAGFKAWVVSADAERTVGRGSTHRVSVTLAPHSAGRGPVLVAGDEGRGEGPGDVSGRVGR
jgi:Trypsin-co-occurring domain 2